MKDDNELILGDGLLAQIEKGSVATYKPANLDDPEEVKDLAKRWRKFCEEETERMKNYKPTYPATLLLSYPDDMFKILYFDDSYIWMGGESVHNAIEERAKKLGL